MNNTDEVRREFTAQKPEPVQIPKLASMHRKFMEIALKIAQEIPPSANRTVALRKLQEAKMAAIHAITHAPEKPSKET